MKILLLTVLLMSAQLQAANWVYTKTLDKMDDITYHTSSIYSESNVALLNFTCYKPDLWFIKISLPQYIAPILTNTIKYRFDKQKAVASPSSVQYENTSDVLYIHSNDVANFLGDIWKNDKKSLLIKIGERYYRFDVRTVYREIIETLRKKCL